MKPAVRRAVVRAAEWFDRAVPPRTGVTVLIYHRVGGGSASAVDLEADEFARQLAHLAEHHRLLTLDAAVAELAAAPADARPGVVVTFDDGTADFTDVAVPLLVEHAVPATLYAATRFVESGEPFPWGAPPASWAALREAVSTGLVTIGSHTHSHLLLDRVGAAEAAAELDRSIELIGAELGSTPEHFAYPKALPGSPAAEVEVRRRFRSAALARSRTNPFGATDPHRLWRTPVQRGDDAARFAAKAAGGMRLEGELRAVSARLRYGGAAT